jgi:transposase
VPARAPAQVLLKLGDGWSGAAIRDAFDVCRNTAKRVRVCFLEEGMDAVLTDKVQERRRQALTGEQHAHLIAIGCSPSPDGHDHRRYVCWRAKRSPWAL